MHVKAHMLSAGQERDTPCHAQCTAREDYMLRAGQERDACKCKEMYKDISRLCAMPANVFANL